MNKTIKKTARKAKVVVKKVARKLSKTAQMYHQRALAAWVTRRKNSQTKH